MKILRRCLFLLAALGLLSFFQSTASAQTMLGGCGGAGGFASPSFFGYWSNPYSTGRIPTPPYFSIHPPVYYSVPVPRTYGYSPYAYPGWVRTPEIEMPTKKDVAVIENPFYKGKPLKKSTKQTAKKTASTQMIVINPFVERPTEMTLAAN